MKKFIPQIIYDKLPRTATRLEWVDDSGKALARSVKSWERSAGLSWKTEITKNRLECNWVIRLDKEPPLLRLSYRFGDIIHNTRSVLDNALFEYATSIGIKKGMDNLEFIICEDEDSWDKAKWKLQYLPQELVDKLKLLQPFNLPNSDFRKTELLDLKSLNNIDKHRAPFLGLAVINPSLDLTVEAKPYKGEKIKEWHWQFTVVSTEVRDGSTTLRLTSKEKIGEIKGEYNFQTGLFVKDLHSKTYPLTQKLAWMYGATIETLGLLLKT